MISDMHTVALAKARGQLSGGNMGGKQRGKTSLKSRLWASVVMCLMRSLHEVVLLIALHRPWCLQLYPRLLHLSLLKHHNIASLPTESCEPAPYHPWNRPVRQTGHMKWRIAYPPSTWQIVVTYEIRGNGDKFLPGTTGASPWLPHLLRCTYIIGMRLSSK